MSDAFSNDIFSLGGFLAFAVPLAFCIILFVRYEKSQPCARTVALIAILGTIAALLRVPFAAFPGIQPSTILILIAGSVFGKRDGATIGMLTVLISNMFLGHGIWTLWQMAAWGTVGYAGGLLGGIRKGRLMEDSGFIGMAGFFSGMLYGFIVNVFTWLSFYPLTIEAFVLVYALGIAFDISHSLGNLAFGRLFGRRAHQIIMRYAKRFEVEYMD